MNPMEHMMVTWLQGADDVKVYLTKLELQDFLASKHVTYGKLQEKTLGQIFCEVYEINDPVLSMFKSDEWCLDRIRSFYVK
jgi:hypothetical protein